MSHSLKMKRGQTAMGFLAVHLSNLLPWSFSQDPFDSNMPTFSKIQVAYIVGLGGAGMLGV